VRYTVQYTNNEHHLRTRAGQTPTRKANAKG